MTACNPDKDGQWKVTANAKFRPRPENTQSWGFMEEEEEEEEEEEIYSCLCHEAVMLK